MVALSFDDVSLQPRYSTVESRHDVDISTRLGDIEMDIPIISSPMDTVTGLKMASGMYSSGGRGIIHRYMSPIKQAEAVYYASRDGNRVGAAVGVNNDEKKRVHELLAVDVDFICVDVAHGHHSKARDMIHWIKNFYDIHVMAGNVGTATGYTYLSESGADSVRVGIGGGSMCTTRVRTGHGLPTLESMLRIRSANKGRNVPFIADGGIRSSGDIVKSLAAGASAVILGRLLAGVDESPAKETIDGVYKEYRGMASEDAQLDWRGDVSIAEGAAGFVRKSGPVEDTLQYLCDGVRSGLSYSGARNIEEFQRLAKFEEVTHNGYIEGTPHGT